MFIGHVWEVVFVAGLVLLVLIAWVIWRTVRAFMREAARD